MTRLWAALAVLLTAAPASAARVVVHDVSGPDLQRVQGAWMLQFGDDIGVRWVAVTDVFAADQPVVLLGDTDRIDCTGAPATAAEFVAATEAVVSEVTGMNYEGAGGAVDAARAMLPCLTEAPSPEQLAEFHFMRGIVAFYAEGPAKATDRFEEALLVSPFLQWDTRYPPPVKPSFDQAITSAIAAKSAFLTLSPRITSAGTLWLNGVEVDARTRTRSLYTGTHLLQWREPGAETTRNWVVDLEQGASVSLVERTDAVRGLLQGDADAAVTEHTQAQVLAPVERNAGGVLFVADATDPVRFHSYDPIGSRWRPVDVLALERYVTSGRRIQGVGVGLAVVGGVLAGVGTAVYLDNQDSAFTALSFMFDEDGRGTRTDFDDWKPVYDIYREDANRGGSVAILGGILGVAGIPLAIIGAQRAKGAGFHKANKRK